MTKLRTAKEKPPPRLTPLTNSRA